MEIKQIETRLVIKTSKFPRVCTHCDKLIPVGEVFHQEEGSKEHLHSLIARQFCTSCYARYGEPFLIAGSPSHKK